MSIVPYTYITIGQDYDSIRDYIQNVEINYNINDERYISTINTYMFYTDIQSLRGLYEPVDYGGGIQYANGLIQLLQHQQQQQLESQPIALQIGLWLNGSIGCTNIINGQLQTQIYQLFHYCLNDITTTNITKIYLRIGYEFDNPDFGYSNTPNLYRQAFQYIINECYTIFSYNKCRNKIDFVWHSWAASINEEPNTNTLNTTTTTSITLNDFYPGDDYVDWVGISIFSQLYTDQTIPNHIIPLGNIQTVQTVCNFAQKHNKPIMIAESTPFGGIDKLNDPWQDWFVPVLQLIDSNNIHMWSYIYCNWDSIPMWNNTGFGESRITQNKTVLKLWYKHVIENPRFQIDTQSNIDYIKIKKETEMNNHLDSSLSLIEGNIFLSSSQKLKENNTFNSPDSFMIIALLIVTALFVVQYTRSRYRRRSTNGYSYNTLCDDDDTVLETNKTDITTTKVGRTVIVESKYGSIY